MSPASEDAVDPPQCRWGFSNAIALRSWRIAAAHGARAVCVFGSLSRGEGDEESDLHLLVDIEPGRSLLDLITIEQHLEDLLGRPVDVVTRRALSPYLREQVLAEAVPL